MIPQRTMRPSIASEQLDPRFAASRHTTATVGLYPVARKQCNHVFLLTGVEVKACPGAIATLPCYSTKRQGVDWRYRASSTSHGSYVVASGHVQSRYQDRFRLNQTTKFQHSLVVLGVQPHDQGLYICIEDAGLGPRHQHFLTVNGQSIIRRLHDQANIQQTSSRPDGTPPPYYKCRLICLAHSLAHS